jgi:hypothetical protein
MVHTRSLPRQHNATKPSLTPFWRASDARSSTIHGVLDSHSSSACLGPRAPGMTVLPYFLLRYTQDSRQRRCSDCSWMYTAVTCMVLSLSGCRQSQLYQLLPSIFGFVQGRKMRHRRVPARGLRKIHGRVPVSSLHDTTRH